MPADRISSLFAPRSIALIGASERPGALGTVVLANLREAGFSGPLHLVNPRRASIAGAPAFADIGAVPGDIDLAIIVTPAATVPGLIEACGARGVRAAIVMSAGFREAGEQGRALEREMLGHARRHGLRILGPNCLGVIRSDIGFNGTFSASNALPGRIGLVSQSGALCTAILDWARVNAVGFSSVISTGIGADVDFGEMLDFLTDDPLTDSIMLYIEGIHRARPFMDALRRAARSKPVVVMKAGRHAEGSRAAFSHTGALVGSDRVFDAALRRAGVLRVADFANFFSLAATLGAGMHTTGRRLAIVTNAGGPGVMAADHAADRGLAVATLAPQTLAGLDAVLPSHWSHGNPVDVLGDADAARYAAAFAACLADPGVDGLVAILTPQALTAMEEIARALIAAAAGQDKPVLACWMGEPSVVASRALFRAARLPSHRTPEAAVDAFAAISTWGENQRQLRQQPEAPAPRFTTDVAAARRVIEAALGEGRSILTLPESKAVLAAFHIDIVPSLAAGSAAEAVAHARQLGFPVAMKILSPDISHKSDVNGVRLKLADAERVTATFDDLMASVARLRPEARLEGVVIEPMAGGREVMVGVAHDEAFGPTISFGLGGTLVELLQDAAVALPPLNHHLAADLISRSKAAAYLRPFRGEAPADEAALHELLLRVSALACELPWLVEMDLNPVMIDARGARAIDARLIVRAVAADAQPYAHLAIPPWPADGAAEPGSQS